MKKLLLFTTVITLTACSSKTEIKYPDKQTNLTGAKTTESQLIVAKSAYDFSDNDIAVPANFDTQGLENCRFDLENEADNCPLKKPILRVYFGTNQAQTKLSEEAKAMQKLDNGTLGLMFESQLAGLNRFRIVTRDDAVTDELNAQFNEQSAENVAEKMMAKSTLQPDYLIKIDTVKTADRFYAEYNGVAQYSIEMTASVIDPYTKEKLSYPNIGKIRIRGEDVKNKNELVYTEVSGRYYTGFDYTNIDNINAVFSKMASKGFDVLLSRLLTEMPVSAQVVAIRGDQVSLDRGRNAGVLDGDTIVLFKVDSGFVDPIAVATAKPSSESTIATIVKWKNSPIAEGVKKKLANGIYKPLAAERIFAVSVGLPEKFVEQRM